MTFRTTAVAAVLAIALAGCSGGDDDGDATEPTPSASASEGAEPELVPPTPTATLEEGEINEDGVRIEITITADGVQPQGERVDVALGQPVTLVVTSDVADEVHVHSDPEVTIDAKPGETVEETFTIDRPGQVAVESHEQNATIVQLVVQR